MNDPSHFTVLRSQVSVLRRQQAADTILQWVGDNRREYVNVCTSDTILTAHDSPRLAEIINHAGLATPDGMPLVWIGRSLGLPVERVYGPDLMLDVIAQGQARNVRHYFYGATDEVLKALRDNLKSRFPDILVAGSYAPPFRDLTTGEVTDTARHINNAQPDIVWVGLGTPKQDYWLAAMRPRLDARVLIAIGAAFNFHAGTVRQAPVWMRRSGLEWLFRLVQEPRHLAKRYLLGIPRFVWLYMTQRLTRKPEITNP